MPKSARRYITAVACVAVAVAAVILPQAHWSQVNLLLFFSLMGLQAIILVTADFPRLAESTAVPTSVAVQLAGVVLLTPGAAAGAVTLGSLAMALRPGTPRDRLVFVISGVFLTPAVGCLVYDSMHGSRRLMPPEMPHMLLPIVAASLALSAMPALLVGLLRISGGRSTVRRATRDALLHTIPRNLAYSFVGVLAAVLWRNHAQVMATLVVLGPLLVTRWATNQYAAQRAAHDATVRALVQAVEIKDLYTRGHSERVAEVSELIARRLGLEEDRIAILSYAAILHDVGKLGVPTRLLQKDGRLDPMELAAIKIHPARGVEVVRDIAFLDEAYTAILHHHERMDGRGYPAGLAGERIPKFARIIAVADAFDSMTSTRSYRPARPVPEAVVELRNCAGSQFDPEMVDAIEAALGQIEREGRPWTGDGTISVLNGPAAAGLSVQRVNGSADGVANGVATHTPGPRTELADVPCPLASEGDEYDHDDPAFAVPSPIPELAGPTNGVHSLNRADGANGANGANGVNGVNSVNGANGGHGANGANGTKRADANANGNSDGNANGTPLPRRVARRERR